MPSSNSPQTHQSEPESEPAHLPKSPETGAPIQEPSDTTIDTSSEDIQESSAGNETPFASDSEGLIVEGDGDAEEEEEEEEEEGECGFCLFMKGGGCKETFIEWEKCVEEGENNKEDIVDKCFQVTAALKKCMEIHSDYYAPVLQAEKAAQEEAVKQLERERSPGESGKAEKGETLYGSENKEES